MAAVNFGAALEALQSNYSKQSASEISSLIINPPETWHRLSKNLIQQIETSECSGEEKRLLTNKINGLNSLPQSLKSENFFRALNLQISTLEKKVWQNRNRAAHGGAIAVGKTTTTIRENNVLMTLLHRTIIAICGISQYYYDYYNLGRPMRALVQSVAQESEDN